VLKKLTAALIVLALLGAGAFRWARAMRPEADSSELQARTVRVARRDIEVIVKASGIIKPRVGAEVKVGSRLSGVVKHLYARVGDHVTDGQLLAELDDRDLIAKRNEADAAVQQADVTLRYARSDLSRRRQLADAGLLPLSELDVAERAAELSERQLSAARASLDYAATQMSFSRIVAPISGIVASVSTQEGETVAASFSAPTFVTLIDLTRLEVWAYVDETDIGRIRLGRKATFTVDTYGDHGFDGRVTAVYPKAEIRDNVVNYVTVIRFEPPNDRTLRPEMTATVRVMLESREHVLALPVRAVRREGGQTFVLRRHGDRIERQPVTTGLRDDTYWEIVEGVQDDDEVLQGDLKSEVTG
jgi:RND family efflux transporter MFP subunit